MLKHLLTLLRLVHNKLFNRGFKGILCLWGLCLCLACSNTDKELVDRLNDISYTYHYRSIDSTLVYARQAFSKSSSYHSGKAEALNNLAFVSIAKMDYSLASKQLDSVLDITDNQIELLVADVQYMRLCQRKAKNKDFYNYKEHARQRMKRINEERDILDERMARRLLYAETEYHFVTSTYFYYVGLYRQGKAELDKISHDGLMQKDTAQYLNWLYQYGSGGMIEGKTKLRVLQLEYDKLLECYLMSKKLGYRYWEANAMQSLSEHFVNGDNRKFLLENNPISIGYLNTDNMPDSLLAGYLAQKSMNMFTAYGDVYQTAGSIRTLAQCFWEIGDNRSSILWLNYIFDHLPQVKQAPDLIASIREQMSIVYSSMNDKYNSDTNRNIYLDMQERTRQDMELDARAAQLDSTSGELNLMIVGIIVLIIVFFILIILLLRREAKKQVNTDNINNAILKCKEDNLQHISNLNEKIEDIEESRDILLLDIDKNERRNIDNRSKVFLVDSVTPLIDRMINEVDKLLHRKESEETMSERHKYIKELSEKIDEYNAVLTQWIQLRHGDIGLHIESFPLSGLFDILDRSKTVFLMQRIKLTVEPTSLIVKADRILTLFMLNTIADNARKFTPSGGEVTVVATEDNDYIEVSVTDTGCGMTEEQLTNVFNRKVANGHGFGLSNCRGILDKYRKVSKIFDVCRITAESSLGKGSRFSFRLPKGTMRLIITLMITFCGLGNSYAADHNLQRARAFADSAYYSNVNGTYSKTIAFVDSARTCLNDCYLKSSSSGKLPLMSMNPDSGEAAEILWFRKGVKTDYAIILDIRNEAAVAALALHSWDLYHYNNDIYTKLFKEVSADSSLGEYCRIMQRSETNKNIAIAMLVLLFVFLLATGYVLYYRRAIKKHTIAELNRSITSILQSEIPVYEKLQKISQLSKDKYADEYSSLFQEIISMLTDAAEQESSLRASITSLKDEVKKMQFENDRLYVSNNILENCLSTIKHETMYYPARINHCISAENNSVDAAHESVVQINDLITYYKELYSILSEQLHRQLDDISMRCVPVDISHYLSDGKLVVWGNKSYYDYLFFLLKKKNNGVAPKCSLLSVQNTYVRLEVMLDKVVPAKRQSNFFMPCADNIPFMICRQIIRETSNATNLCGCGITARQLDNGTITIILTLPYCRKE